MENKDNCKIVQNGQPIVESALADSVEIALSKLNSLHSVYSSKWSERQFGKL